MKKKVVLERQLNAFDTTNLVIGATIGADIYVAASLCAKLLGPASILIWLIGGIMATVVALSFGYCAAIFPKVGGPYVYAKEAAGTFSGFMVGWALVLAEWFSLAVFPVAFTQYFLVFFPNLDPVEQTLLKGAFMLVIFVSNVIGVREAGKFNDALTIAKVTPLILIMCLGSVFLGFHPDLVSSRFQPFFGGNMQNVGQVLVIVFWAYAGFELSTLPADEIQDAKKTIPRALTIGMLIAALIYMLTNFVVIGVVDQPTLASSQAPLVVAASNIFSFSPLLAWIGSIIVGVGALVSIMGADESGTMGTSRLAFAMSVDGYLPRSFSHLHKSYHTPYVGLAVLCVTAYVASVVNSLSALVNSSVFLLSLAYLATGGSALILGRRHLRSAPKGIWTMIVPGLTVFFSIVLMTQVTRQQVLISLILLAMGIPVYAFFSPKKELLELKESFLSEEAILDRSYHQQKVFLAYVLRRIKLLIYRIRGIKRALDVKEEPEQNERVNSARE